jgi:hypothetical protein
MDFAGHYRNGREEFMLRAQKSQVCLRWSAPLDGNSSSRR